MTMEQTFLFFLLEVTAKATVAVGVAGVACWMLRRASAAVRHFVWVIAIASVLAMPALTLVMPRLDVRFPAFTNPTVGAELAPPAYGPAKAGPYAAQKPPAPPARVRRAIPIAPLSAPPIATSPDPFPTSPDRPIARSTDRPIIGSPDRKMPLPLLLFVLWLSGAAIALCRFFAGHLRLWWIGRHTDPITDPTWIDLSRRVASQLRLSKMVRLLRCRRPTMPVCWGVRRPSLLLPSDADSWTAERRRIVLLHELAHAKRRDCLTQAIGQLAIAMHWFNPLVWLAVRRLRVERERACDDLVLAAGASAPDYADHLLEIARAFRTVGCPSWAAVAMARPSQLEGRLLAILDRRRNRGSLTRRTSAAAAALALATMGTLAAVQPAPAAIDARSSSQAVAKSRPHPTPAVASGTATVARSAEDAQPAPMPAPLPHAVIVPDIDIDDAELEAELEAMNVKIDGVIGGIKGGVLGGIVGGVLGGVGKMTAQELEQIAHEAAQSVNHAEITREAVLNVNVNVDRIALEAAEAALWQIGGKGDNRAEADPRIVAALAAALKDSSPDVRRQAATTLSQMRHPQVEEAMIAATADSDAEVRQFAVRALTRYKSDAATKALVRALKDANADVRKSAMHGVARLRDPQYIDVFAEALKDANADVRQQAAHALAQLRDGRAVPALIVALKDADTDVRQQAAHALGEIGDARAVDPLVAAMKDANPDVREHVVQALGRIGHRAARGRE